MDHTQTNQTSFEALLSKSIDSLDHSDTIHKSQICTNKHNDTPYSISNSLLSTPTNKTADNIKILEKAFENYDECYESQVEK